MTPDRAWAAAAAQHLVRYRWETWWYADSVGFEGLLAATDITGESRFQDFAYGMARAWLGRRRARRNDPPPPFHWSDHTAPAAAMIELALRYDDAELLAELERLADWLISRPQAGGLPLLDPGQALCVWVDCMQFQGPFLARLARATGQQRFEDGAVWFLLGHDRVLRGEAGLYSHIYDVTTGRANGVHWGRGQGWAMLGLWQTLAQLPGSSLAAERIRALLAAHLDALIEFQAPSGHWPTIVDDPRSYEESSVAAFYLATAIPALAAGLLDRSRHAPSLQRAAAAFGDALHADGRYTGVSGNTHAGPAERYRMIPLDVVVPWGQGPALLAAQAWLAEGGAALLQP